MDTWVEVLSSLGLQQRNYTIENFEVVSYRREKLVNGQSKSCFEFEVQLKLQGGSQTNFYVTQNFFLNEPEHAPKAIHFCHKYLQTHRNNKTLRDFKGRLTQQQSVFPGQPVQSQQVAQRAVPSNQLEVNERPLYRREEKVLQESSDAIRRQVLADISFGLLTSIEAVWRTNPKSIYGFGHMEEVQRAQTLSRGPVQDQAPGSQPLPLNLQPDWNFLDEESDLQSNLVPVRDPPEMIQPRIRSQDVSSIQVDSAASNQIQQVDLQPLQVAENLDQNNIEQVHGNQQQEQNNENQNEAEVNQVQNRQVEESKLVEASIQSIDNIIGSGLPLNVQNPPVQAQNVSSRRPPEVEKCCLCLSPIRNGKTLEALVPCSHVIHRMCKRRLLKHERACPLCREIVLE